MTPTTSFADLPVELSGYILLFAKDLYALHDKSTLANLSRVSRAIHALVQPAIAETVTIDCSNASRVCATPSAFTATRCLVVSLDLDDAQKDRFCAVLASTPAFRKLEMFSGSLSIFYDVLNVCSPTRVVVASLPELRRRIRLSHEQLKHLSRITHLRGKGSDSLLHDIASSCIGEFSLGSSLARLSHVVLDVDDVFVWNSIFALLPRVLSLAHIERICLRASPGMKGVRLATVRFARSVLSQSNDAVTRLWMDIGTTWQDDAGPGSGNQQRHAAFNDVHWLVGEPLQPSVEQPIPGLATL